MALKLTLVEIENWLRGKAETAGRLGAREAYNHADTVMRQHMKEYKHIRKPVKIKKK